MSESEVDTQQQFGAELELLILLNYQHALQLVLIFLSWTQK